MIRKHFKNEHFLKYFFNTGWFLSEKVIRIFANAIVGIVVARYLGPENYGSLNYAISFISIFVPIASLGLGDIIIREFMKGENDEGKIIGTALQLRLFCSFFLTTIILLITYFSSSDQASKALVYVISFTLVFQSIDILDRFFQSKLKVKTAVISYIISLLTSAVFKICLVILKAPLIYFAYAQVGETAVLSLSLIYFYRKNKFTTIFIFEKGLAKKYLKESWMLVISGLMVIFSIRIDQVMIKHMLGAKPLGNFSAAVKLSESYYFVSTAISAALYPAIIIGKKMSDGVYRERLQKLYDLITWIAIPIALVTSIFAVPICNLLYGSKFEFVGQVLTIHIWGGVFVYWGVITSKWFILEKLPYIVTLNTAIAAFSNIVLNYWFIPHYGIIGAAYATLISQAFSNFLILFFIPRTRSIGIIILKSLNGYRVLMSLVSKKSIQ